MCQNLFFNKVWNKVLIKSETLFKKKALAHVFSCEFCEIYINSSFTENLWATASVE